MVSSYLQGVPGTRAGGGGLQSEDLESEQHIVGVAFCLPMETKIMPVSPSRTGEKQVWQTEVASRENTGNLRMEKRSSPILTGPCTLADVGSLWLCCNYCLFC